MFSDGGLVAASELFGNFVPFLVITSASLVLFSNLDRKLCLLSNNISTDEKNVDVLQFEMALLKELRIIRILKVLMTRSCFVVFGLISITSLIFLVLDYTDEVDKAMRKLGLILGFSNWIITAIALAMIMYVYERVMSNIHNIEY